MNELHNIVSFGGGTNSAAIVIGMHERGEKIHAIVFADTGGEKPETYQFLDTFNAWLKAKSLPQIDIVKGNQPMQQKDGSLENECLRLGVLPSKAYGFGSCSMKWKVDPQNLYRKQYCIDKGINDSDVVVLVGFDANEHSRVDRAVELEKKKLSKYKQRFPLYEWGWGREECVEAIKRAGLPQPGKSACFFCPSSKKHEILWLKDTHPDLFARAVAIEQKSLSGELYQTSGMGLGRSFSWKELAEFSEAQLCLFSDAGTPEIDCGCFDGE